MGVLTWSTAGMVTTAMVLWLLGVFYMAVGRHAAQLSLGMLKTALVHITGLALPGNSTNTCMSPHTLFTLHRASNLPLVPCLPLSPYSHISRSEDQQKVLHKIANARGKLPTAADRCHSVSSPTTHVRNPSNGSRIFLSGPLGLLVVRSFYSARRPP